MEKQDNNSQAKLPMKDILALERTRIAYERTMMAWARTATSFITFGFAIYKFFEIQTKGLDIGPRIIGTRELAIALIAIGLVTLLVGKIEHGRDLRALAKYYPGMPVSGTRLIAAMTAVFGAVLLVVVMLRG